MWMDTWGQRCNATRYVKWTAVFRSSPDSLHHIVGKNFVGIPIQLRQNDSIEMSAVESYKMRWYLRLSLFCSQGSCLWILLSSTIMSYFHPVSSNCFLS